MPRKKKQEKERVCSFCGKTEEEVMTLIAGPNSFICDECTQLAMEILSENHRFDYDHVLLIRQLSQGKINFEQLGINPAFNKREFSLKRNQCFVLCPFREPFNTIYTDHIMPIIQSTGLGVIRADDIYGVQPIIEDIWEGLNSSAVIVAELTGRNPNVMYEVGIAHTIGKPVILVTQSIDDIPFDLKHYRCILYEYTPRGCKDLEEKLQKTLLSIPFLPTIKPTKSNDDKNNVKHMSEYRSTSTE